MKRLVHTFFFLLAFVVYGLVKNSDWMVMLRPHWFDMYQLGDLYRFSWLPQYRDTTQHNPVFPPSSRKNEKVHLYMIGDSFGGPFEPGHFPAAGRYSFVNWNHLDQADIQLAIDTSARNILVLESSEKHILLRFKTRNYLSFRFPVLHDPDSTGFRYVERPRSAWASLEHYLSRPAVTDQNLGILYFSNPLALWLKEQKAQMNKEVFGKMADEVEEFPERNMLVQTMTTKPKYLYMSGFRPHSVQEIKETAQHLDSLARYYRNLGFDTCMLALIPNPISTLVDSWNGKPYNQVLQRVQEKVEAFSVVDCYTPFRRSPVLLYRRGDTHWNQKGEAIWLRIFNHKLDSLFPSKR